jgi:hypothetical protein
MHPHPRFWSNATDQRFRVADLSRQLVSRISGHPLQVSHYRSHKGARWTPARFLFENSP